jgi:hypothetical protein
MGAEGTSAGRLCSAWRSASFPFDAGGRESGGFDAHGVDDEAVRRMPEHEERMIGDERQGRPGGTSPEQKRATNRISWIFARKLDAHLGARVGEPQRFSSTTARKPRSSKSRCEKSNH